MKEMRELKSHALLVGASLFMLLALTVAWFIHNNGSQLNPMSFAAQWSGAGAVIYPGEITPEDRVYDPEAQPNATLSNTVTWAEKAMDEETATIEIQRMVPGQCSYYLLKARAPLSVYVKPGSVIVDGKPLGQAEAGLTDALALYLIPLDADAPEANGGQSLAVKLELTRAAEGWLEAAVFRTGEPTQAISPLPAAQNYVLAVYCDQVYGQIGETGIQNEIHAITGSVKFSLFFAAQK